MESNLKKIKLIDEKNEEEKKKNIELKKIINIRLFQRRNALANIYLSN